MLVYVLLIIISSYVLYIYHTVIFKTVSLIISTGNYFKVTSSVR